MGLRDAVIEAGHRRLRPILMTAATTIIAMIPLAPPWARARKPRPRWPGPSSAVWTSSTLITLVVVPVVYYLFEHKRDGKKKETP